MAQAFTIRVNVAPTPYDVVIRPGLLRELAPLLSLLTTSRKCGVVTDTNLQQHHLPTLQSSLAAAGRDVIPCILPAGEQHKTLATIARIYDTILPAGIDRKTPLLALGGGVIGDMTGFAAATILRGIPFIQLPTTLLAMVDASVGGKTGIDHPCGKNLIGAFHQPLAVLIDPEVLLTLPERELIGGLAECIKHDIIRDAAHFERLPAILAQARQRDINALAELVAHNVAIKARVVEADPLEKGERAHLNFGHTFAHAFETISNYAYSHGEAVGIGMVAASRMARSLGMIDAASVDRITATIAAAGLPTGKLALNAAECAKAMTFDKKVAGNRIRFVLPDRVGHVVIRDDVPTEKVIETIESLRE